MGAFYSEWLEKRRHEEDDSYYITSFLRATDEAMEPLMSGCNSDLESAFLILKQVPIEEFIEAIKKEEKPRELIPVDVPCFSNLKNGASRLNELLEFEPNGISFEKAGYQLMHSVRKGARLKYGENHSKLAAMMSLVMIYRKGVCITKATPWGTFLTRYDWDMKEDVLRKLLLRDLCVKSLVKCALEGSVMYRDVVKNLAPSTAIRRRSNVKCLVNFVLKGTAYEKILSYIDWEV